jgi:mRNA interferase MazF
MTDYRFGEIVLLDFPFSDRAAEKKRRPGLVLAQDPHGDLLIARISSKPEELPTDVQLADWKTSSLNIPSTVRLLKLASIHRSHILRAIGKVTPIDSASIITAFRAFVSRLESQS